MVCCADLAEHLADGPVTPRYLAAEPGTRRWCAGTCRAVLDSAGSGLSAPWPYWFQWPYWSTLVCWHIPRYWTPPCTAETYWNVLERAVACWRPLAATRTRRSHPPYATGPYVRIRKAPPPLHPVTNVTFRYTCYTQLRVLQLLTTVTSVTFSYNCYICYIT